MPRIERAFTCSMFFYTIVSLQRSNAVHFPSEIAWLSPVQWNLNEDRSVSTDVNIVRTVRHRSRIFIAALLLLAQIAMGRSLLICTLTREQLAEGLCPMQNHSTGDCCHKQAKPKKNFSCYVSSRQQSVTSQVAVPHFEVPAIVFEPISVETNDSSIPASEPIHLILPRIRTPDIGANGLRAPPSR